MYRFTVWRWVVVVTVLGLLVASTSTAWAEPHTPEATVPRRRHLLRGEVTSKEDRTLTVKNDHQTHREVQVLTDDQTRFRFPGADDPGLDDLSVGDRILVVGIEGADGKLLARVVVRPILHLRPMAVLGRITAIERESITLVIRRPLPQARRVREITVKIDEQTHFWLVGTEDPGLDDLRLGQIIAAIGHREQDGILRARLVGGRLQNVSPGAL